MPLIADNGVNDPMLKVFSLPFIFNNKEHAWRVLRGPIGEDIITAVDTSDANIIGLGFFEVTARNFFTVDKPVRILDDMQGLKIRVRSNELYPDMIEAFGASPTPIAFSELHSALQTGEKSGRSVVVEVLGDEAYKKYLDEKLSEELQEYLECGNVEELADMAEVIFAILEYKGIHNK